MRSPSVRSAQALVYGLPLVVYTAAAWLFRWVSDDAYISFRYSRNLARGAGLRYNLGDPPVEGFSNLGWVLWMTPCELVGADPAVWAGVSGYLAGALLLVLLLRVGRQRLGLGVPAALACGVLFATSPTVAIWTTSGLATMAFAAAVFVTWERLLGDPERPRGLQAAATAACVVLLRADGVWWLAALLAFALGQAVLARRADLGRQVLTCTGIAVAVFALQLAWRVWYFGDWVPNTARAKVSPSWNLLWRGVLYVAHYALALPGAAAAFALGAWLVLRGEALRLGVALGVVAATFLYGALVGGDFMSMGRFFLPAWPFLALFAGVALERLARRVGSAGRAGRAGGAAAALAAGGLLVLGSVPAAFDRHWVPRSWLAAVNYRWDRDYETEREFWDGMLRRTRKWSDLGRALAIHAEPGSSFVRVAIGCAGYFSDLTVYDRAGLTSREVALEVDVAPGDLRVPGHDRVAEPDFFADREPTYSGVSLLYDHGAETADALRDARTDPKARVVRVLASEGYFADGYLILRRPGKRMQRLAEEHG